MNNLCWTCWIHSRQRLHNQRQVEQTPAALGRSWHCPKPPSEVGQHCSSCVSFHVLRYLSMLYVKMQCLTQSPFIFVEVFSRTLCPIRKTERERESSSLVSTGRGLERFLIKAAVSRFRLTFCVWKFVAGEEACAHQGELSAEGARPQGPEWSDGCAAFRIF